MKKIYVLFLIFYFAISSFAITNLEKSYREYRSAYERYTYLVKKKGIDHPDTQKAYKILKEKTKQYGESIPENIIKAKKTNYNFNNLSIDEKVKKIEKYNPEIFDIEIVQYNFFSKIGAFFRTIFKKNTYNDIVYKLNDYIDNNKFEKANKYIEKIINSNFFNNLSEEQKFKINTYALMIAIKLNNKNLIDKRYERFSENMKKSLNQYIDVKKEKAQEIALQKELINLAKPYVDAHIQFSIAHMDNVNSYRKKAQNGNKLELHGDEYYEKYLDPKTYRFYSNKAYKEYTKIGGSNCIGFAQNMNKDMFKRAGMKYPLKYNALGVKQFLIYGKRNKTINVHMYKRDIYGDGKDDLITLDKKGNLKYDTSKIPPKGFGPGDIMFMKNHGDGSYWHSWVYLGKNEKGQILIANQSGSADGPKVEVLPEFYLRYLAGFMQIKGADKARKKLATL